MKYQFYPPLEKQTVISLIPNSFALVELSNVVKNQNQAVVGPGPRFELGRKAPQASMLPSYTTPAALMDFFCTSAVFM
jgi:hypothetical protein